MTDEVPGVINSFLPEDIKSQSAMVRFSPTKNICLHTVRLLNGAKMEEHFGNFLT
jgi:hypothetical protein